MSSFAYRTLSQSTLLTLASTGALAGIVFSGIDVTHPIVAVIMGAYVGALAAGLLTAGRYRVVPGTPIEVERRD